MKYLALSLAAYLARRAAAQDFPAGATIASCADVKCPDLPNSVTVSCTVVDKTFNGIGLALVGGSDSSSPLSQLSWVEGVAIIDNPGIGRAYDKSFYLATPRGASGAAGLVGNGTVYCAIFFSRLRDGVRFGANDDISTAQGTCQEALGADCVSALVARAKAVDVKGLSPDSACAKLQQEFIANLDTACSRFARGTRWDGVVFICILLPG